MNRRNRTLWSSATLVAALAGAPAFAADFNGDGFDDVAITSQRGEMDAYYGGTVYVLYGSASGLMTVGNTTLKWTDFPIDGPNQPYFGAALAAGDFDGDGFDDLAIGAELAPVDGHDSAGLVLVVPGSATGIDKTRFRIWTRDTPGVRQKIGDPVNGTAECFGWSLAAGNFDGDRFDDLAISVFHNAKDASGAGGVHVLYGSKKGLSAKHDQFFTQDTKKMKDAAEANDFFGRSLRAGDLNGDGFDDLVAVVLGETSADGPTAGAVAVMFGSNQGLSAKKNRLLTAHQLGDDAPGMSIPFCSGVEVSDLDRDGKSELILGLSDAANGEGRVAILHSIGKDIDVANAVTFSEHVIDPSETNEAFDQLGASLATGDFDHDGFVDLVAGAPIEAIGGINQTGLVQVLRGNVLGFATPGTTLSQNSTGVPDTNESNDQFGATLSTGDFNGDGFTDLLIGLPQQAVPASLSLVPPLTSAGRVIVLYGAEGGLGTGASATFTEPGGAYEYYMFGWVVTH